jgi:DNA-binding NarL/FixJ family response regulator
MERHAGSVLVLVVDDSVPCRAAVCDVVRATPGFVLVGDVGSGEEAIVLAARVAPDLVLLDIRMDGISGFETAKRLRFERPEAVVVLASAWVEEAAAGAGRCGAAAVVHKRDLSPAVLEELWELHGSAVVPAPAAAS